MRSKRYPSGASPMLAALGALRGGAVTFNQFERSTREDWTRIARALHARWPLPPSVSVDDVRQELLLAVVVRKKSSGMRNLLEKWDPHARRTRAGKVVRTELDDYVVWNARVQAARWIHAQRGAKRNRQTGDVAGKIRGTFLPVLSSIGSADRGDALPIEVPQEAVQEQVLLLDEALRREAREWCPKRTREIAETLLRGREHVALQVGQYSGELRSSAAAGMVTGLPRRPGRRGTRSEERA